MGALLFESDIASKSPEVLCVTPHERWLEFVQRALEEANVHACGFPGAGAAPDASLFSSAFGAGRLGGRETSGGVDSRRSSRLDVVIVDFSAYSPSEWQSLLVVRTFPPETQIIGLTGDAEYEAIDSEFGGRVFELLAKPIDRRRLRAAVSRALKHRRLLLENRALNERLGQQRVADFKRSEDRAKPEPSSAAAAVLIGESAGMRGVRSAIAEVAPSDMTVLIRGETGTGKDITARLIHELSGRRRRGALVKINCPTIPESLIESELFGYEAGAFTDAKRRKPGRVELASGGSIFLDEIAEIPPVLQTKLLQLIEHREFTRLGGTQSIRVDTRLIVATNADLESMIREGLFRADLFYRLSQYTIQVPPLRDRIDDIPLLIEHFLKKGVEAGDSRSRVISRETMERLKRHAWPGNVRELESMARRFVLSGNEDHFPNGERDPAPPAPPPTVHAAPVARPAQPGVPESDRILSALRETCWNRRRACALLGMSYNTLRRRIKNYGLANRN